MNRKTLYIAYGSNMNVSQMGSRCPYAKVYGIGKILDYRLTFKALGMCAYATIEPCNGDYVPAVIWEIREYDEIRLDRYEGFPTHYYKEEIRVDFSNRQIKGMVYLMNQDAHYAQPSSQYFDVVLEGYGSFGLDKNKLYEALHCKIPAYADRSTLRYYRQLRGLTQKQLANMCGLREGMIQKYESGERNIAKGRADCVLKLAEVLEVPALELLK